MRVPVTCIDIRTNEISTEPNFVDLLAVDQTAEARRPHHAGLHFAMWCVFSGTDPMAIKLTMYCSH